MHVTLPLKPTSMHIFLPLPSTQTRFFHFHRVHYRLSPLLSHQHWLATRLCKNMYLDFVKILPHLLFFMIIYLFIFCSVINTEKVESSSARRFLIHVWRADAYRRECGNIIKYSYFFLMYPRNCIKKYNKDFWEVLEGKFSSSSLCILLAARYENSDEIKKNRTRTASSDSCLINGEFSVRNEVKIDSYCTQVARDVWKIKCKQIKIPQSQM